LSGERGLIADGLVNPLRLPGEIRVNGANDDAGVLRIFPVQADEVAAIQRKSRFENANRSIGEKLSRKINAQNA
jgi:hypothetical protein